MPCAFSDRIYPFPYLNRSRDTSSSDSDSGERTAAVSIFSLVQPLWCSDSSEESSSDDDNQVENNLADKSMSNSKPCKMLALAC